MLTLKEKFSCKWVEDKKTGCHDWVSGISAKGYGLLYHEGRVMLAHRVAWKVTHGEWPELDVLHKCDNRRCVNPDHLFLGSNQDNVEDAMAKNRFPRGERVASAQLTDKAVLEIRKHGAAGTFTHKQLAEKYGVGVGTVKRAMNGETWKHLPGATPNKYKIPRSEKTYRPTSTRKFIPPELQPKYEVRGEWLTATELADKYGIMRPTVANRAKKGLRGEDLIAPPGKATRLSFKWNRDHGSVAPI
jgi:hypothetical protein